MSAYSNVVSQSHGSKIYVPVNKASLLYSHFDHVSGIAAKKGQNGVSISKIQMLNTIIDHLSSIKSGKIQPVSKQVSSEQIDTIIKNYQTQLKQAVQAAQNTPYQLTGVRPEAGALFSIEA